MRPLGRGGLTVGPLSFGTAPIGNLGRDVGDDEWPGALEAAWAAGVRYFDTAPHYGLGLAERRLGTGLAGARGRVPSCRPRSGGCSSPGRARAPTTRATPSPTHRVRVRDYSRDGVLRSLEASLERLGRDRVDLLLVHDPDDHYREALEGAFPALEELRAQGVIASYGAGMNQAEMLADFVRETDLDVVMLAGRYTLLEQGALDDLLPECERAACRWSPPACSTPALLARTRPRDDATYNYDPAPPDVIARASIASPTCSSATEPPCRSPPRNSRWRIRPWRPCASARGRPRRSSATPHCSTSRSRAPRGPSSSPRGWSAPTPRFQRGRDRMDESRRADAPLLLDVRGVSKTFPGVKALEDMHLDLHAGEVLGLVGENGAGKSTLMKLLSGMYDADAGEFFFAGERYEPTSPKHALELGISIIHQEFNLMPDLTVAQNLFIGRERGIFTSERRLNARAQELIERLHLPLRPKDLVGDLTVAKQQMVEIGKALSYDARLLIMDEPTAALNDAEVEVLHGLIRRFIGPDTGVIYVSHRMDELRRIAQRITVIRDGRYIGTRETAGTSMQEVIAMMVGRELTLGARPEGRAGRTARRCSRSKGCRQGALGRRQLHAAARRDLGFAGLMGAGRTEVARAIVGADRMSAGTIRLRGREVSHPHAGRGRAPSHRLPVRGPQAVRPAARAGRQRQHRAERAVRALPALGLRPRRRDARRLARVRRHAAHQDAVRGPDRQEPLGRQPAEGRDRQMAGQGLRHPHLRRADAGHRRRRQGGDLPLAQRPRRLRQVDHHDLLRAARDPAHVAPDRGHERGPRDRHLGRRGGHAGARHAPRDAARTRRPWYHRLVAGAGRRPEVQAVGTGLRDRLQQFLAFASLITIFAFFSIASSSFLNYANVTSILFSTVVIGLLALGTTFVIITSGIDLSIGTGMTLCAVMSGVLIVNTGLPVWLGVLGTILFGGLIGS